MQAARFASFGTRASKSPLKSTEVHQQGGCFSPVRRSSSLAQALDWPHKGQRLGSTVGESEAMPQR
jgi:hypothetical protein